MSGFPKPPYIPNRERTDAVPPPPKPEDPFKDIHGASMADDDPRLTEDETRLVFEKYLRPDQRADNKLMKFILSYLECRSASQAARDAGLKSSRGASYRNRPEVHACIEALTAKSMMKYGYDAGEIIERVKEISNLDPIEFENADGSYKTNMSQIRPEARRAIKKFKAKNLWALDANGMKIVVGQLIEVELWDKLKAHELLGREKNIMKETKKIEHDVTGNMASLLLDSARRGDEAMKTIDVTPRVLLEGEHEGNESGETSGGDEPRRNRDYVPVAEPSGESNRTRTVHTFPTVPGSKEASGRVSGPVYGDDAGESGDS